MIKINRDSKIFIYWSNIKFPLYAIVLGFFVGAVFIIVSDNSPAVAYKALFQGSLGDLSSFGETLYKTTPIIFTGLSVAFAFRTGLFNIGAEGQYIMGTISAVAAGWFFQGLPKTVLIPAVIISGALAGALWASVAGLLKAKIGVHEVITTIMLNYTALHLTNFIVKVGLNPQLLEGTEKKAHTVSLPESARLMKLNEIIPRFTYSSAHTGIIIAIVCAAAVYFILFKTVLGYEIRSVGKNPNAAEYGVISKVKNIIIPMAIAGALSGIAKEIIGIIQAVIILFVAADQLFKIFGKKRRKEKNCDEENTDEKEAEV